MNKQEYILFIFEGRKDEPLIFENLQQYFLEKKENGVTQNIVVSYGTVIYSLYKKFFIDDENDYTKENWNYIINEHCQKANHIVNDDFKFPTHIIEQHEILYSQDEKFIKRENKVSVLSAFPIMLMDYYGCKSLKEKISD